MNEVPARIPFSASGPGKKFLAFNRENSSQVVSESKKNKILVRVTRKVDPNCAPDVAIYRELVKHAKKLGSEYWLLTQIQGGDHPVYRLETAAGRGKPRVTSSGYLLIGSHNDLIAARAAVRKMAEDCAYRANSKATLSHEATRQLLNRF